MTYSIMADGITADVVHLGELFVNLGESSQADAEADVPDQLRRDGARVRCAALVPSDTWTADQGDRDDDDEDCYAKNEWAMNDCSRAC